jgi:hypothetical protein
MPNQQKLVWELTAEIVKCRERAQSLDHDVARLGGHCGRLEVEPRAANE